MRSGYSTTTPRRKNTTLSPSIIAIDLNINTTAEHSWFEDHALYLVGSKEFCLLWVAETWRFHYGRSVSATIDSFESCIARKTAGIRAKTMIKLFFFMTTLDLMSLSKKNIWKCSNGMFYRTRYILRTLLLLITGCSEGCSKLLVHFFSRNRKLDRFQRRVIFSR